MLMDRVSVEIVRTVFRHLRSPDQIDLARLLALDLVAGAREAIANG